MSERVEGAGAAGVSAEIDLIALTDLGTGRVEFERFGSTPFADVPKSPYYVSRPGFWLSTRTWLDDDGVHAIHAHDCRETREVHLLPWPTWQAVADGQVLPSFSCDDCGLHYFPKIDAEQVLLPGSPTQPTAAPAAAGGADGGA